MNYMMSLQVNEGKVPQNRVALRMLAEEMINWPNLEVTLSFHVQLYLYFVLVYRSGEVKSQLASYRQL